MAHVDPLSREEIQDAELLAVLDRYEATRGFVPNSVKTMARRPKIAKAFAALNQAILYEGSVDTELKMLVSLMASLAAGCRYCQSHMTNLSSIYHASDEKIAALWSYEDSPLFDDAEKAALRLAHHAAQVPNEVRAEDFAELEKYFDEGQIVEIMASIALFGYLNRWNDSMATTLEDHPRRVCERTLGGVDWHLGKHRPKTE